MLTTSQKPVDTQKIKRKKSKYISIENYQITKKDSKRKEGIKVLKHSQKTATKMAIIYSYL